MFGVFLSRIERRPRRRFRAGLPIRNDFPRCRCAAAPLRRCRGARCISAHNDTARALRGAHAGPMRDPCGTPSPQHNDPRGAGWLRSSRSSRSSHPVAAGNVAAAQRQPLRAHQSGHPSRQSPPLPPPQRKLFIPMPDKESSQTHLPAYDSNSHTRHKAAPRAKVSHATQYGAFTGNLQPSPGNLPGTWQMFCLFFSFMRIHYLVLL